MITCRDLIGFLHDYVAGEVPAPQKAEFERHVAVCPECVAYLRTYEETIALGRAALTADEPLSDDCAMPEDLVKAIVAALRASQASGTSGIGDPADSG